MSERGGGTGKPGPVTEQRIARRERARREVGADPTPSLTVDLERLFAAHRPRLLALARRLTGRPEHAQELVQQTLEVAWTKLHELDEERRFEPWIFGIARNLARNARRKRTELLGEDGVMEPTSPEAGVLRSLQRVERAQVVTEAVNTLAPADAEVVHLRYVDGLAIKAIDEVLGLSGSGARAVLQRCRRALRQAILDGLAARGHGESLLQDGP
jgi:RNA polymerase sigma-70 factor (ECF subfamily)